MALSSQTPLSICLALCALALTVGAEETAKPLPVTANPDGSIHIHDVTVPPSPLMSEGAKLVMRRTSPTEGPGAPVPLPALNDIKEVRRIYNQNLQANVDHMKSLYPVDIEESTMDGISVAVITPKGGVPERNKNRVMINAPGGGFRTGVRGNGLLISIPVASLAGVKVISLLYRQAPEFRYPAATEDFMKVYRQVIKTYKGPNIGMFGCSAGAVLMAEGMAAIITSGLPRPGVLGLYCGGAGAKFGGDSAYFAALTSPGNGPSASSGQMGYFEGADLSSPLVSPAEDLALLAKFPPTLYLSGTRDMAMSSAAYSYRRMQKVGVESVLLVYDGMFHGAMTNPDFPESRDAYEIAAKFYDKHLGR